MSQPSTPISSLYVLKALCAVGVVILHAPLGVATDALRHLASITVPVFFMITGYFLYHTDRDVVLSRLSKSMRKIVPLILLLNLVYYPLNPIQGPIGETYMLYFKWLALGMTPGAGHLWYLTALLQALIILWLWFRLARGRWLWLFLLLWIVRAVSEEYRMPLFGSAPSILSANVLCYALPCVVGGIFMRRYEGSISGRPWGLIAGLSIVLSYINEFGGLWPSFVLHPLMRTAMIISIFAYALQNKPRGQGSCLEYIGRELSGNIYYFHGLFILLMNEWPMYDSLGAIYVLLASVLLAYTLIRVQDRLNVSILR